MIADALQRKLETLAADWRSRAGELRHEREPSARFQGWAVGLDEAADDLDAALAALRTERGEEPLTDRFNKDIRIIGIETMRAQVLVEKARAARRGR